MCKTILFGQLPYCDRSLVGTNKICDFRQKCSENNWPKYKLKYLFTEPSLKWQVTVFFTQVVQTSSYVLDNPLSSHSPPSNTKVTKPKLNLTTIYESNAQQKDLKCELLKRFEVTTITHKILVGYAVDIISLVGRLHCLGFEPSLGQV